MLDSWVGEVLDKGGRRMVDECWRDVEPESVMNSRTSFWTGDDAFDTSRMVVLVKDSLDKQLDVIRPCQSSLPTYYLVEEPGQSTSALRRRRHNSMLMRIETGKDN